MAEDPEKKDEEKFELDSAGESLGYISLDQARVLALQHARDNREFYGRYADREFVWEELSAEESEDYYRIRLAYRPAGNFRSPGIELITIDKTGPIEFRQIISQPQPSRRTAYVLGIAVVLAATGAIIGGLFASGAFSSSGTSVVVDPTVPVVVHIAPDARAQLVSPQGDVTIDVSIGSVSAPAQLAYQHLTITDVPALPKSFSATGTIFDLTTSAPLIQPITVTARFSSADATLAGDAESNVVIQHHHDGAWKQLDTSVDFVASTATAQVDSLSIFALTIKQEEPVPLPTFTTTPAPTPLATDTPVPMTPPTPTPVPTSTPIPTSTLVPAATVTSLYSISGTLFESGSGVLRGATVTLEPMGLQTQTSLLPGGSFAFQGIPPGTYTLTVAPQCTPFGCYRSTPVAVDDADVVVSIVPEPLPTPAPTATASPVPTPIRVLTPIQEPTPTPTLKPTSTPPPIPTSTPMLTFTSPPTAIETPPVLLYPVSLPGTRLLVATLTPGLTWTAIDQALDYRVQIATDPSYVAPILTREVGSATPELQLLPGDLQSGTVYFWQVQAISAGGITSDYSSIDKVSGTDGSFRTSPEPSINILPNPSFEEGDKQPAGWQWEGGQIDRANWNSSVAQIGKRSIALLAPSPTSVEGGTLVPNFFRLQDRVPIDPSGTYEWSVWCRWDQPPLPGENVFVEMVGDDSSGNFVQGYGPFLDADTDRSCGVGEWSRTSFSFGAGTSMPIDPDVRQLFFAVSRVAEAKGSNSILYFDDISLTSE